MLMTLLDGLWDKADRYRQLRLQTRPDSAKDTDRVRREHAAIAEAVIAGDARTAERVMRTHVRGSLGRDAITDLEN
jgi:DNA-binding FadR family transcriptional regulator